MNSFTDNFTINGITLTAQPICRQDEVLTPDALEFVAQLHRATARRRQELLQARRTGGARSPPARTPGSSGDRAHPQRSLLARRSAGPGAGGPPGGDHRARGQEDDHQRAELRRQGLARGHGGLLHPVLAQRHPGPAQPHRRAGTPDRLHLPGGQGVQAPPRRGPAHHRGPPPRLAPAREAHAHRRHAGGRRHRGLRPVLLPQRPPPAGPGQGPVLLPAEDRKPPRSTALERHLHPGPGPARHPAGHHPRHRADRNHHRSLRDGGDPLRTARPRLRPERRPLGLHLLPDQELPHPRPPVRPAGPRPGDHDRPVHARLHRTAGPRLPQARRHGDRRNGSRRSQPQGRRRQRQRLREGPRGQDPRGRRRLRRLLGGPPGPGSGLPRSVRRRPRRPAQPAGPPPRGRHPGRPRPDQRGRHHRAPSPNRASGTTSKSASATSNPGSAATAPWPSTTSWKTPPPRKSPAPSSGSGSTPAPSPTTAKSSPATGSRNSSTKNSPAWNASTATASTTPATSSKKSP